MTGKADFSEEEWKQVAQGPTSAGVIVASAQRGGTFRESFSMAKAYAEARKAHGESELLDTVVSSKPEMDKARPHSTEELRAHELENLREAVAVVEQKATPEELDEYKRFIVSLAEHVAEAAKGVSDEETAAIEEIKQTIAV